MTWDDLRRDLGDSLPTIRSQRIKDAIEFIIITEKQKFLALRMPAQHVTENKKQQEKSAEKQKQNQRQNIPPDGENDAKFWQCQKLIHKLNFRNVMPTR